MKQAIIVIDMLIDFVTGALACKRAEDIVPALTKLLDEARKNNVPVIFCNDAHLKDIDHEFKVWAPHALAGTPGAQVIPECKFNANKDYLIPKRKYSAFFQTDLDALLRELGADTVVLTGIHTHICVQHTAADAFQLGYDIIAVKDCINAFTQEDYDRGMTYMKDMYGAKILTSKEIIDNWKK